MNIDYNTSLKGEYTLFDENMNILSETKNLITDWGMRRFVADYSIGDPNPTNTDESGLAFVNNMRHIMLGTDSTTPSYTDFKLISAIPTVEYTTTNEGATTGTLLSTDSTGNLLMIFTRMTRFQMASSFNVSLAPTGTYSINEVGCSWSQTVSANNRYGIFSRVKLPSPVTVKPKNVIFAKYQLTIKTNANQILSNMYHLSGTGATFFPNNKTNIRKLPLYTLTSAGEPSDTLNSGLIGSRYSPSPEYVQPLFEEMGLFNDIYGGSGNSYSAYQDTYQDNTFGTSTGQYSGRKLWWLQLYTTNYTIAGTLSATNGGAYPSERWSTFTSTTTSNLNNSTSIQVASPAGSDIFDVVVSQNLNWTATTGRKKADSSIIEKIDPYTWKRTIRFLFTPGEFKSNTSVLKLYPATLGNWDGEQGGYVHIDNTATHNYGIVTVFNSGYTPNSSLFNGYAYSFNFTRN